MGAWGCCDRGVKMAVSMVNESLQGISNAFHMNSLKSVELVTQYMATLGAEDGEAADCLGATLRELVDLLYGVKRKKANPKKKKLAYPTAKDVINHIYRQICLLAEEYYTAHTDETVADHIPLGFSILQDLGCVDQHGLAAHFRCLNGVQALSLMSEYQEQNNMRCRMLA